MAHLALAEIRVKERMGVARVSARGVMAQRASVKKTNAFVTRPAVQPSDEPMTHAYISKPIKHHIQCLLYCCI